MAKRIKRKKKIFGTAERPRLSVFRSAKHIHAQIIDDVAGKTLVAASSLAQKASGNVASAKKVGKEIAEKAITKKIKKVVFDRGRFQFHGRLKALADAAREGGLLF
ncbi:MAG: 50S ribosomal protein L18 [Candidatus Margulisbacteria bacterium]|nr:50S ribosomal protein L18 [Candidatus Margulisiibacteriota bacterium]